jgi:hypothetical protein
LIPLANSSDNEQDIASGRKLSEGSIHVDVAM